MNYNEIVETIKHYHQTTDDNVVGVMFGHKTVNGILTDEKSIVFSVIQKLPKEELREDQLLPKHITIGNETISTDVVQRKYIRLFTECDPDFYTWRSQTPTNRTQIRPLEGGISCSNWDNQGLQYIPGYGWLPMNAFVGTLGVLAVDNETNSLVGLTNHHVIVYDSFISSDRALVPGGDASMINNIKGNNVTQPNEQAEHGLPYSIGKVKRYYPMRKPPAFNQIDAALLTIDNEDNIDYTKSFHQLNLDNSTYEWASTYEIDNLTENTILYSSGRTTGAKGEGNTKLRYFGHGGISINYNMQGSEELVYYDDVIMFIASTDIPPNPIVNLCYDPISGGDSGSALIADINGAKKIIGLVFAGAPDEISPNLTTIGIACRIDRISSLLNVSAWNGSPINFSDTSNIEEIVVNGLSDNEYIDYDGKKYWQVGLING